MHELVCHRDYRSGPHLRSASGFEVDFILDDHTAVEAKAKEHVGPHDLKSLRALKEENKFKRLLCVTLEPRARVVDGITLLPLDDFLKRLRSDEFVK